MRLPALILMALSAPAVFAGAEDEGFKLAATTPIDIADTAAPSEWSTSNADNLYLTGGGLRARENSRPSSKDNNNNPVYYLAKADYGATVSEQQADFSLGDWCTVLPTDTPESIDWVRTGEGILDSAACRDEGRLYYNANATNDLQRILFTRGGDVSIDWYMKGRETPVRRSYQIAHTAASRPYRIFWTEKDFDGPVVMLGSSSNPKHVRLLGDPAIVKPRYEAPTVVNTPSNIVFGVVADDTTGHQLRVYAQYDDSGKGMHEGPRGQFVMAYYDSGSKDHLIYTVVVEVSEPRVEVISAHVGDQLLPSGSGYSKDFLVADIQKGVGSSTDEMGDSMGPYIYKHRGFTETSPKTGNVYAIAPTDASSQAATGLDAPHKADIWWITRDPMGTQWPFEHDWYLISWNKDDPVVVTGGADDPGAGIMVPESLSVAACAYSDPLNIVTVSSNIVTVAGAGRFTLKITGNDNIWFLPMRACLNSDTNVFEQAAGEWHVGTEISLRADSAAGIAADLAALADASLPGYIHESASTGRNWNPHLYHAPRLERQMDTVADTDDADPYAGLVSSIYAVRASDEPIEVWWYRTWQDEGMGAAIRFPIVAQRYRAIWPLPEEAHAIVLVSQLGSATRSYEASGKALYLAAAESTAQADGIVPGSAATGTTIGFWVNTCFRAAEYAPLEAGRVLTAGEAFTVDATAATNLSVCGVDVAIPTNDWTHVACAISATNGTLTVFRDGVAVASTPFAGAAAFATNACRIAVGASGACRSAAGVGIDTLAVWPFLPSPGDLALYASGGANEATDRRRHSWTFDGADDLEHVVGLGFRTAVDNRSGRTLAATGCLAVSPGGPAFSSGTLQAADGVEPRIYVQNDSGAVGYNPNEEHAFVRSEPGGYTVYALRCDLNGPDSSEPFVLAEYSLGGKGAMKAFHVSLTNAAHCSLEGAVTVGNLLAGPHPLDYIDGYYNTKNYCLELSTSADAGVVYRDRHNRMWARRDGLTKQFNFYPVQPGFWFPSLAATDQPDVGTLVGWMAFAAADVPSTKEDVVDSPPLPWTWWAVWPDDEKIPFMRIGQTLTTANAGLPEVWNAQSMAVVYPVPRDDGTNRADTVVTLIDPTVAQTAPLQVGADFVSEYGFTLGSAGTCQLRGGKYYFTGLPPNVSDRFYIDMNAAPSNRMVLVGQMVEKKAGTSYLQVNTLSSEERAAIKGICKAKSAAAVARWNTAVDALATDEVRPSRRRVASTTVYAKLTGDGLHSAKTQRVEVDYSPVDHYALVANGCGTNYVTLVENDSPDERMVPGGSPISMHVLKVVPELYAGGLVVLQDPNNKLSEQLNILYTEPFGKSADDFEFQWRRCEPPADGHVPDNYGEWAVKTTAAGATGILLGGNGTSLTELVNTYYVMRYRAKAGTPAHGVIGNAWSGWCGPTLAEGWVQRVLNNVTPFVQRISDFYANAAELNYTMPGQIGGPYRGDVALNEANLESVGLVELYQTILNKAESLSLSLGIHDVNANKQLMEAASRLADLYVLLGDDAYSDAADPTIAAGSVEGFQNTFELLPANTYCFANQVPSLLDEELALLRGRTSAVAPNMTTYPYYNRLMWNFTKGITQGEMAYVQNYGIVGTDGEITPEQAARQYPMGHGDAYGHYLSAVWGYYRLLRNPHFSWGDPGMMEMLVADSIVNMDYEDEQKLAMAAAKMAQTGLRVTDLTARKTWRDQNGDTQAGYFDANSEQGFGYGEWAVRTGLGAFYNWATVNSLLPTNQTSSVFADHSIADVTRATVPAIGLLAENFAAVDAKVNTLDAGLNPLGLSDSAIPFDIDPVRVAAGTASHFEQILERAERALGNAQTILDHANRYGSRLRQITLAERDAAADHEQFEAAYKKDLIAIYGTPYPDDIGPSGTYVQGYDGPDIYHYQYMDLGPYGLTSISLGQTRTIDTYALAKSDLSDLNYTTNSSFKISYNVSSGGLLVKPGTWKSVRATEGSIQAAYREFLSAYVAMDQALLLYNGSVAKLEREVPVLSKLSANAASLHKLNAGLNGVKEAYNAVKAVTDIVIDSTLATEKNSDLVAKQAGRAVPWMVAGLSVGNNGLEVVVSQAANAVNLAVQTAGSAAIAGAKGTQDTFANVVRTVENAMAITSASYQQYSTQASVKSSLSTLLANVYSAALNLRSQHGALAAAEAAYRAEVAKGDRLLAEREMLRRQQSNCAVANRYADMYYRVQHNAALSKFNTAFDVAQRYVWQLAKVYDYETGLLSSDPQAGDAFLRETIATCALGVKGVTVVPDGTDGGLWDVVERMKGNWDVLKGRLGVNNPDTSTKWFSLRYSLLRINPDTSGDAAWRQALGGYWVDDILSNPEFARYCQPPQGGSVGQCEPGLVIPFSTSVNLAENFFGKSLLGGETTFSSSDYAVKIHAVGVQFAGYDNLTIPTAEGLAVEPNVYLVPIGNDFMRAPSGTSREALRFRVVDQVLPLPYVVGSAELNNEDWLATFAGLDGMVDSAATIRRHSTLRVGDATTSSRLIGRSVWNDRWLLVIPASSLSSDRVNALKTFINGLDSDYDGKIDIPGVADIKLGIKAYSRSGN